jgi:hypothetical protein
LIYCVAEPYVRFSYFTTVTPGDGSSVLCDDHLASIPLRSELPCHSCQPMLQLSAIILDIELSWAILLDINNTLCRSQRMSRRTQLLSTKSGVQ